MALTSLHSFPRIDALIRPASDPRQRCWVEAMQEKGFTVLGRDEKLGRRAYVVSNGEGRLQFVQWPDVPVELILQEPDRSQQIIARSLYGCGLLDDAPARVR